MLDSMTNENDHVTEVAPSVLSLENLSHRLWDPERGQEFVVTAERLVVTAGSFVAILGPNACGKTTLLTVVGLLRKPHTNEGRSRFLLSVWEGAKRETFDMIQEWKSPGRIERFRRQHLGFALQSGELLTALTVRENIALPLYVNGWKEADIRDRVHQLLEGFALLKGSSSNRLPDSRVNKLAGSEYQRVALARAIVHRPDLVFVDEPTASLNHQTARVALNQLRMLQQESAGRTTIVMITHDRSLAYEFADTIVRMEAVGPTAGRVAGVDSNLPQSPTPPSGPAEEVLSC